MDDDPKDPKSTELPTESAPPLSGNVPSQIGPYRLLQKLGEGGMGEVFFAEQTEPVRRRVALKVIKQGMDTKQVVARFEAERQALAMMDHPAVARVFDAGTTPGGRPYFAMEYVKGVPLTVHCDRQKLSNEERLKLFLHVCEGVQHAHQKAIIHRDLKPSNVLVSIQDGKAVPKIIDFGVAKATAQRLTEKTIFTQLGVLIGTPEYMSPEQAEMTEQDVDTRTDVYSLGVMLYELLVGALPFDSKELRSGGLDAIRRKIREEDPPRPSTRLSTLGEQSTESAKLRQVDLPTLQRQLRGDLDWITMKALEKDRTRRYGSPMELAADVERHLEHEPVLASPPSTVYRARKFVRRHRVGVAFAAVLLALLVGFGGIMTVEARRIAHERDRANREAEHATREAETSRQVSDFLVDLFQVVDPGEARGNAITAREILDRGAQRIERELESQPEVAGRLLDTMGWVYKNLGLYDEATALLERALQIRREALGSDAAESLQTAARLGHVEYWRGRLDRSIDLLRKTLRSQEVILGPDYLDTAWTAYYLGGSLAAVGKLDEAREHTSRARAIFERELGEESLAAAWALNDTAYQSYFKGELKEARFYFERALEVKRRVLGDDHFDVAIGRNNLGYVLLDLGLYEEARLQLQEALRVFEHTGAHGGTTQADVLQSLGRLELLTGNPVEAEVYLRKGLEIQEAVLAPDHPDLALTLSTLGQALLALDRRREAFSCLERALRIQEKTLDPSHADLLATADTYAAALRQAGKEGEAAAIESRVASMPTGDAE